MKFRQPVFLFMSMGALVIALVLTLATPAAFAQTEQRAPKTASTLYLPFLSVAPIPSPCTLQPQEQEILNFMRNDPNQKRASLTCNPILEQVARARAQDMGQRAYFSHVNPDGYGPNYLVRQAGYTLPSYYSSAPTGNNIEAIAAGYSDSASTWNLWMGSPAHQAQLLGTDPFFAAQTDIGIGYAAVPGSPYIYYWVVITARH